MANVSDGGGRTGQMGSGRSIFDQYRNHTGGFLGSLGGGLDDVYNSDNPFYGLNREANNFYGSTSPDTLTGIQNNFGSVAGSPLGQYLSSRAGVAQRQFDLAAALGNQATGPDAWQQFAGGFVNGLLGQGGPSPYIASGDVGNVLKQFGQMMMQPADKLNQTAQGLRQDFASNPSDIVDYIMSALEPQMAGRLSSGYRNYLSGRVADYMSQPIADRSAHIGDFINALASNVGFK